MTRAHYDAFEALLPAGTKVFRGSAPAKPLPADYPYVVLGGDPGEESGEAATGEPDSLDIRFRMTYAALTFDQVLTTIGKVRDSLRGRRLVVPGWSGGLFRHQPLVPIRTDFDVTVPDLAINPVYAVDEYALFSTR
jgi:hypothetical protein